MKNFFDYFFDRLVSDPVATDVVIIAFSFLTIVIGLLYVIAFWEGSRKVSFWPPQIGPRPNTRYKGETREQQLPKGKIEETNTPPLSRRAFIATAIGSVSVGFAAGWVVADWSRKTVRWKMTSFLDENAKDVILYQAPQMVCDLVKKMSGGHFIIELYKNGNTKEILKNVSDGRVECGFSGIYYNDDTYRVLFFGTAIPFGLNPQEQNAWLYYKENVTDELTYVQKIHEKIGLNVVPFPAGATGAQMGGWFNKKINSKDDFENITMRIPGLGAEVLRESFRVRPDMYLPGGALRAHEIAKKLADGTLDAAEWTGPYDDFQLGLHKVARYYYYPGWWEPGTTFDIQVNKDVWKKLPDNYKEIFKAACSATHAYILTEYEQKNSEKLQEIKALRNIEILPFSIDLLKDARAGTNDLLDFYSSKNEIFREVYGKWRNFRDRIQKWNQMS